MLTTVILTAIAFAAYRTVQEREQDYSKARARIFAQEPSNPDQEPSAPDDGLRNANGSRAPMMGPQAAGRGRAIPGRGDPGKKAVFRNREQDLQDPDYRRGYNRQARACTYTLLSRIKFTHAAKAS